MLEARNLIVGYDGREVLRDVSLTLNSGDIVVLLGANGAGKTTLIRTLNGTITPAVGMVVLDDRPIAEYSRREIARKIAVVAQENETKFPVTVLEFVLGGRFAHGGAFGWESEEDLAFANEAIAKCDLSGYADRLMNELSGGERQRVVLARALAAGAAILLLDEPTANLDLAHQALMFKLVREQCRSNGRAAIVITHDLNLASEFADRVILLHDGQPIADGNPKTVLTQDNILKGFGVEVLLDQNPMSGNVRVTAVY